MTVVPNSESLSQHRVLECEMPWGDLEVYALGNSNEGGEVGANKWAEISARHMVGALALSHFQTRIKSI